MCFKKFSPKVQFHRKTIHSRAVEIHTINFENIQTVRYVQCLVVRYQLQRCEHIYLRSSFCKTIDSIFQLNWKSCIWFSNWNESEYRCLASRFLYSVCCRFFSSLCSRFILCALNLLLTTFFSKLVVLIELCFGIECVNDELDQHKMKRRTQNAEKPRRTKTRVWWILRNEFALVPF